MIKISEEHKRKSQEILANYSPNKYDSVLQVMTPILTSYYPTDPAKIGKRLLNRLFESWLGKENEAIIHYWTICKLVLEYGYPSEQVDIEIPCGTMGRKTIAAADDFASTHADIVVYSHESRRPGTALLTIECRELGGIDGSKQAASYSRALGSKYHAFTDSAKWNVFETQPHPLDGTPVSDIPFWVGKKPLAKRLSKNQVLPPLTDERQLRDLVKTCHDSIHGEGVDPAKAFDELVKLFFVKVYDEQEIPNVYQFSVLSGESIDDTGQHIRELLKEAKEKSKYRQLFEEPGDDEFSISNRSIRLVVETFHGFSFTGSSVIGIDAKGTVYENMVGSTFRGELGQYFTPRKIVQFMVNMLVPVREDKIFDPACGSGGFLIYVLKEVATQIRSQQKNLPLHQVESIIKYWIDHCVFGVDISPRMVRASRMNMIMHGDGWSNIQRCHGLIVQEKFPDKHSYNTYTLILSNPPFAGFEMDEKILSNFKVGKNEQGNVRGVNRAIIFIEQIINLLAENGRAGIVLPRSIFENDSYSFREIRKLIYDNCEVLALIGLPKTAFVHTDTGILGDLLFVQKKSNPRKNYDVFVDWAENVGYNTLGHDIEENDLPLIRERFDTRQTDRFVSITQIIAEDNMNPWHYHQRAKQLRATVKSMQSALVPLPELVSIYPNRISRKVLKQTPERVLRYVEVGDFDPEKAVFSFKEHKIATLPSRATYEMNGEELVLLPNAKNSLESRRRIIKVGTEMKGTFLTNRFLPLRPKVNADFLVLILNTDFVRKQLIDVCRGAGSPDFRETKLKEVMIPVPDKNDLSSIDAFMESIEDKIAMKKKLEKQMSTLDSEIVSSIQSIYKEK
ncbi:N-6 DNA methylase [Candidatus Bathyarchaeota archaeon]|nr:N-6 DNA methylase [Candidatus Bathyarchaeota archaeon]